MPAALGNLISRTEYNSIYNSIKNVLGDDGVTPQHGYGRTLQSSEITTAKIIESEDMLALYNDLVKARTHQKGATNLAWTNATGLNSPSDAEIVGVYAADVGSNPNNPSEVTSLYAAADTNEGFADFELAATDIINGRFLVGAGQTSISQAAASTRNTQWGGNDISAPGSFINHTITITWANANERRYFFNSGGEIRFAADFANPTTGGTWTSGTKNQIWQQMASSQGTIVFGAEGTDATGTNPGTGSSIGNYYGNWSATSSSNPVTIYSKSGSGVYAENTYSIKAWQTATNSLRFNIIFQDSDLGDNTTGANGTPIDEFVTADTTSTVTLKTATGVLLIPIPATTVNSNL
jgi:hypothetical protein